MSDFATLMEAARAGGVQVSPPTNTEVPAVTGNGLVGEALSCTMGVWTGEPTAYAYAWMSDGAAVEGATAADYTIVAGDVGHALSCVVGASNSAGSGTAPPSNAILVAAASREAPTAKEGERHRR